MSAIFVLWISSSHNDLSRLQLKRLNLIVYYYTTSWDITLFYYIRIIYQHLNICSFHFLSSSISFLFFFLLFSDSLWEWIRAEYLFKFTNISRALSWCYWDRDYSPSFSKFFSLVSRCVQSTRRRYHVRSFYMRFSRMVFFPVSAGDWYLVIGLITLKAWYSRLPPQQPIQQTEQSDS